MAEIVNSLFGVTPESLIADREAKLQEQAVQYAQMDPFQRATAGIYSSANKLGGAIGGMLGAQDPEMMKATALQGIMKQADTTTPEGLATLARTLGQQGFGQQAMQVMDQARQAQQQMAVTGKATAEQKKLELGVLQEEKLRDELSKLPADATEQDILGVVTKYGSADKVLSTLQAAQSRREATLSREEQSRRADETRRWQTQQSNDTKMFVASLANSLKSGKEDKLSSADIKMVNDAQQSLQAADFNLGEAKNYVDKLDTGKMIFGAGENALGTVRSVFGKSTESDQNKVNLQQWVEKSSADLLRMDVGTKTEGDAQRAKDQVLSGLSKNDPKLVKSSLEQYAKVLENAKTIQQNKLEVVAKERNKPYLTAPTTTTKGAGTAANPIVLK